MYLNVNFEFQKKSDNRGNTSGLEDEPLTRFGSEEDTCTAATFGAGWVSSTAVELPFEAVSVATSLPDIVVSQDLEIELGPMANRWTAKRWSAVAMYQQIDVAEQDCDGLINERGGEQCRICSIPFSHIPREKIRVVGQ